jgi:hypothetical protein
MTGHDLGMLGAPAVAEQTGDAGMSQRMEARPGHSGVASGSFEPAPNVGRARNDGDGPESFEYDVALSLAGEDRGYVHPIAVSLRDRGVRVFYDEFKQSAMWGEDLVAFLDEVFRKTARYAVVFISRQYVEKKWPTHEGKSALARALVADSPYFLPVRLVDSELPGLRPTVGYIDARVAGRDQLISLILEKVGTARPIERTPRTPGDGHYCSPRSLQGGKSSCSPPPSCMAERRWCSSTATTSWGTSAPAVSQLRRTTPRSCSRDTSTRLRRSSATSNDCSLPKTRNERSGLSERRAMPTESSTLPTE